MYQTRTRSQLWRESIYTRYNSENGSTPLGGFSSCTYIPLVQHGLGTFNQLGSWWIIGMISCNYFTRPCIPLEFFPECVHMDGSIHSTYVSSRARKVMRYRMECHQITLSIILIHHFSLLCPARPADSSADATLYVSFYTS